MKLIPYEACTCVLKCDVALQPSIGGAIDFAYAARTNLGAGRKLEEKHEQIVMEKVAEAVQKKAEEVEQEADQRTEEKKDVL